MPPDPDRLDVDARFLLANERTLLAWVRTSLTLLAVGGGLAQFGRDLPGERALAACLTVVGIASAVLGGVRYARADRALRRGDLPRGGRSPFWVSAAVALVGVGLLIGLVVS